MFTKHAFVNNKVNLGEYKISTTKNADFRNYSAEQWKKQGWATLEGWDGPSPGTLLVRTRSISARCNLNYDGFPASELKKAYKSFLGKPFFVEHVNDNPNRGRGILVASAYRENGSDKFIENWVEIDSVTYPRLAQEILAGNMDSVSMGTNCQYTICSLSTCGNVASEPQDLCDHIVYERGRTLTTYDKQGKRQEELVFEICSGLGFFELSAVACPADETALFQEVIQFS